VIATAERAQRAYRPELAPSTVRGRFTRGRERPRGVVWFGVRSFWGHWRHFLAAAIATEDVDSRDWMTPDAPALLLAHVVERLGGDTRAATLSEALGRDLFVDYIADTGDDAGVSREVARMLFADYELPAPERPGEWLSAPRGELLIFGGDTAYPVATALEIHNRVIVPFNQVLETLPPDPTPRVLLGIPGNHDWYDGLDGFARMFRRRSGHDDAPASTVAFSPEMRQHYAEWAREFVRGGKIEKPRALVLRGYAPVQNASYFTLALTPQVQILAVDRQLRTPDARQRRFLIDAYESHPERAIWALLPDPVFRFGGASDSGTAMVESLRFDLGARDHFVLTGDVHHYERLERDRLLHVTAGGGGAFLHPTRIARGGMPVERTWPDAQQCQRLLRSVPLKVALGRSGVLPHLLLFALFAPAIDFGSRFWDRRGVIMAAPVATTLVLTTILALIGGVRRRKSVLPLALSAALLAALAPVLTSFALGRTLEYLSLEVTSSVAAALTLAAAVVTSAWIFGAYLSLLTRSGFEHTQAFTALDHPGFKHFVRLRVRADGRGIDGWCIGLVDPLGPDQRPVLVDTFVWRPTPGTPRPDTSNRG
jgi:hypothetical protein